MATLPRYDGSVLDNTPRPVPGAQVYIYLQPVSFTSSNWTPSAAGLATVYNDNQGLNPVPLPLQYTNADPTFDGNGNYFFYAVAGLYTIVITGGTLAAPIFLPDQNLLLAAGGGALLETNGTVNSIQTLLNIVQGTNITLSESAGAVTINGSAATINFKVNGTNASSQTTQNLLGGSGITVTDGGSGNITIASTGALTLQVNGTPNGSQSLLNLKSGTHFSFADDGVGGVTGTAVWPTFQNNSTPLTLQSPVSFNGSSNIQVTNPSAGNVLFSLVGILDAVQSAQVTLTQAQLVALHTTPIQIKAGAGANTIIVPIYGVFEYNFVTAAFATVHTNDLSVYVSTAQTATITASSTGLLDQTVETFAISATNAANVVGTVAQLVNQPMMIWNSNAGNYTAGGTSTLVVTVYYVIYPVV